jgi:signal transduction histidine kinase
MSQSPTQPAELRASRSLAVRLFLAAAVCSTLILATTGVVLSSYYTQAVERGFDRRLDVYLKALVANLSTADDVTRAEFSIGEPRFQLPLSGWYWQIGQRREGDVQLPLRPSRSLFDRNLPFLIDLDPEKDEAATREAYVTGPDGENLRQIERIINFDGTRYVVAVAGEASEIAEEVDDFDRAILLTFSLLGLALVGTASLQVMFGLRPLQRLSSQIAAIRAGSRERIEGSVPLEVAPLAREVNGLIESNRGIVERARTQAGNLAHALKTPLSVIINEAGAAPPPLGQKIAEQADAMRTQINYHLDRARIAAGVLAVGTVVDVAPVIRGICRTMEKVHRDRAIQVRDDLPQARFRGERQDLEEMVGNLVDNACKWARQGVTITIANAPADERGRPNIRILVDDDGPGLDAEGRASVLVRGKRLDEAVPGSGLGLAIVSDLADLYSGKLALAASPAGGLRASLLLPCVP